MDLDLNSPEMKAVAAAVKKAMDDYGKKLSEVQDELKDSTKEGKELKGAINALQDGYNTGKKGMEVLEAKLADFISEHAKTANEAQTKIAEQAQRILDLEQGNGKKPGGGEAAKSVYELIVESEEYKAVQKIPTATKMGNPVHIGNIYARPMNPDEAKTQIVNASGASQPLVPEQRVPGVIYTEQRLFIRDLIPAAMAGSNLIQYVQESSFTNNAGPQGDTSPVGVGEGEKKRESAMTFTLLNAAVSTMAHWIPASRQVLQDATMLQGHLNSRLLYGLKLAEETSILTGTGAGNDLNGINNQAAAFLFGDTNQTELDTLLEALLQVTLANYEASGFILHPTNWWQVMKLKDTQGRYLFVDPAEMAVPRIWGKPVVASQTQTLGKFTCGAFSMGAQIWDREDATIRISDNVDDYFIRNMVAILVEERLALTVYRPTAFVYGNISHAG